MTEYFNYNRLYGYYVSEQQIPINSNYSSYYMSVWIYSNLKSPSPDHDQTH